jgi:hypothetical protein
MKNYFKKIFVGTKLNLNSSRFGLMQKISGNSQIQSVTATCGQA